jgi:hypothetical protein
MKTHPTLSSQHQFMPNEFEEAFYNSTLRYSLRHLKFTENYAQENIMEVLQKSLQVCYLAGVNSKHHFKKIYVFDSNTGTLHIDWLMSKNGFNLMVIQTASVNEKMARWLWELAETPHQ